MKLRGIDAGIIVHLELKVQSKYANQHLAEKKLPNAGK